MQEEPIGPPRPSPWRRAAFVLLFCVLAAGSILAGMSIAQHKAPWEIISGSFTPSPQQLFGKNNILVLVEGLDYDYNNLDVESSAHSRSDVIWAVNMDFANHRIYELSVPRDMVATLPDGSQQKINQAQSDGGVREAQSVIAQWLGIPGFDRYMVFRADTTKDLIQSIGGVDVNVMNSDCIQHPKGCTNGPLDYVDTWGHLSIHLKPGYQHLNGDQAVGYMRYRHDWCGDPCRILRQQEVLRAIAAKLSHDKFNTLLHLNDILGVFDRDVQTNLTRQEQFSLAMAFADIKPSSVVADQVPYVSDVILPDGGDAIVPNVAERARLVHSMLIAPPQPTAAPQPVAAAAPSSIRVDVENGTGVNGMAKRAAQLLRAKGFKIGRIGNAPSQDVSATQLHEHSQVAGAGTIVRDALGAGAAKIPVITDPRTPGASDVTLVLGQDIVSSLSAQTASK